MGVVLINLFIFIFIFIYGFQISFAQQRSPQSPESLVVNSIPYDDDDDAAAAVTVTVHSDKTIKQPVLTASTDKVSLHYPTLQEIGRIDKIVNQTLSMLKPITNAINKSHSCILEAVICTSSSNILNSTMLRL